MTGENLGDCGLSKYADYADSFEDVIYDGGRVAIAH